MPLFNKASSVFDFSQKTLITDVLYVFLSHGHLSNDKFAAGSK